MTMRGAAPRLALAIGAVAACLVYDPRANAADPKRVVALFVVLSGTVACLASPAPTARTRTLTRSDKPWLGFALVTALSAAWGTWLGLDDLATFAGAVGIGVLARRLGHTQAIATARAVAVTTTAVTSALVIFAFALGSGGFGLHAGQGNPNWVGLLLALGLPLTLDGMVEAGSREKRSARRSATFCALGGVVMLTLPALYLAHSRVAWLACAASLATLASAAVVRRGASSPAARRAARQAVFAVGLGLAGVALIVGVVKLGSPRRSAQTNARDTSTSVHRAHEASEPLVEAAPKGEGAEVSADRSLGGRVRIWRSSLRAAKDALPFGVGLGEFGRAYLTAQGQHLATLPPRVAAREFLNATTAHQEILQAAVESGPVAAILLALGVALGAVASWKTRWFAATAVFVALAIEIAGDSPLRQPAPCILVALVVAGQRGPQRARGTRGSRTEAASTARLGVVGLFTVLAAGLTIPATQAWLAARVLTEASNLPPPARRTALAKATRIAPRSGEAHLARGLFELSLEGAGERARHDLIASDGLLANVGTRTALGQEALVAGHPEDARTHFASALAWHPGSLRARMGMAEAERLLTHLDAAEEHARIAVSLAPGEPRAYELVERIHEDRADFAAP